MNLVKRYIKRFLDSRETRRQIFETSRKFCIPMLALGILMTGCINDIKEEPVNNGGSNVENADGRSYYIALNIEVPNQLSTRDDGDGTEEPAEQIDPEYNNECVVENVDVFFLYADNEKNSEGVEESTRNKVILKLSTKTSQENSSVTQETASGNNYVSKYKTLIYMSDEDLNNLTKLAGHNVNVLVVCNPETLNDDVYNLSSNSTLNDAETALMSTSVIGEFATNGKILPMSNYGVFTVRDFKNLTGDADAILLAIKNFFKPQADYTRVYEINEPLEVERGVARLDLELNNVIDNDVPPTEQKHPQPWEWVIQDCGVHIELSSLTPVNLESQRSYLARHWALGDADAAKEDHWLLTTYTPANNNNRSKWVIDPYCSYNLANSTYTKVITESTQSIFTNPIKVEEKKYTHTGTATALSTIEANGSYGNPRTIYPWYYIPENVLPDKKYWAEKDEDENLLMGQYCTGVAFTFKIMKGDNNDPYLKSTDPVAKLPENISRDEETKVITITNTEGKWISVSPASDNCYYITYYGFLSHAGNIHWGTENYVQEYSVVRNTVYQMMINEISGLPFPEDPQAQYLSLTINVLAWVKREIHVTF